jgi:hypothetical protein
LCFEKGVHALHKIHPNMSKANIIKHVVKHKIVEKMVGSPKWHHAQVYDMMAMVDTCVLLGALGLEDEGYFAHFLQMKH